MLKVETVCFGSKDKRNIQFNLWRSEELTRGGNILCLESRKRSRKGSFRGKERCLPDGKNHTHKEIKWKWPQCIWELQCSIQLKKRFLASGWWDMSMTTWAWFSAWRCLVFPAKNFRICPISNSKKFWRILNQRGTWTNVVEYPRKGKKSLGDRSIIVQSGPLGKAVKISILFFFTTKTTWEVCRGQVSA